MAIKQLTPQKQIDQHMQSQFALRERKIISTLCYVGEQCIVTGRVNGSYIDRTGNLRNSIGYILVKDGYILYKGGFDKDGGKDGLEFAKKLISEFPRCIALIIVAGMNYASYVAAKGYDVLDSSELTAQRLVPQMMKKLGFVRK